MEVFNQSRLIQPGVVNLGGFESEPTYVSGGFYYNSNENEFYLEFKMASWKKIIVSGSIEFHHISYAGNIIPASRMTKVI